MPSCAFPFLAGLWVDLDFPFLYPALWFVAALLAGAIAIEIVNRWRKRSPGGILSANDELAQYRALRDAGVMSEDEFDRVRGLLGNKLGEAKKSTPADPAEASPVSSAPPEKPDERPPTH